MGRPKKYTLKFCLDEIESIKNMLDQDKNEKTLKYVTWHDLLVNKPYSRQRISEWRNQYSRNQRFADTIKKIDGELENRLYKMALANKVNAAVAIFGLKNNYGWHDKHEIEGSMKEDQFLEIMKRASIDDK